MSEWKRLENVKDPICPLISAQTIKQANKYVECLKEKCMWWSKCKEGDRNYDDNFEEEEKEAKKCPKCGSDLYEYCFMCCYEGEKVNKNNDKTPDNR